MQWSVISLNHDDDEDEWMDGGMLIVYDRPGVRPVCYQTRINEQ